MCLTLNAVLPLQVATNASFAIWATLFFSFFKKKQIHYFSSKISLPPFPPPPFWPHPCAPCRSVWRASPGHARLHARWDASIWAGSSHGAPIPGRPSHGHEAARHVSGRTLLKQQSRRRHHIRFEVHTFLSSLCFLKRAAAATQQPDLVAAKSNIYSLEHVMDIKCNFLIGKREREKSSLNTTCDPANYSVVILLKCEDIFPPHRFHSG